MSLDLAESSGLAFDLVVLSVDQVGGASQLAPPSLVVLEVLAQARETVTFVCTIR